MNVSIIVVNWNTRDIQRDCLRSIYEQAGELDSEVTVTDDPSTDDSAKMVNKELS